MTVLDSGHRRMREFTFLFHLSLKDRRAATAAPILDAAQGMSSERERELSHMTSVKILPFIFNVLLLYCC